MMDARESESLADDISKTISLDQTVNKGGAQEPSAGASLKARYKITGKLGEGGMGAVYAAFDTQLQQKVAIKLLKQSMSLNEKAVEQLKREALVAMKLSHPLIMRLINFERDGQNAFLLMELVDGSTLESVVKNRPDKKLPSKLAAQITYKICEALEYAHANGVIHRDIKPANIMIQAGSNSIKLMDFGIARALSEGTAEKPPLAGTLPYIAPETLDEAMPDPRTDIYALGLTLYELVAGMHPFKKGTTKEIIQMHSTVTPPLVEGVDRPLMKIIYQCVEKKPNARLQNAQELKSALAVYLDMSEAKVSREKKQVENEKKRIGFELKRLEREREKLKAQQENMESSVSVPLYSHGNAVEKKSLMEQVDFSSSKGKLLAGAAVAGLLGAVIESALAGGETGLAYNRLTVMLVCALAGGIPAYARYGVISAFAGFATGFVLGIVSSRMGASYIEYSLLEDNITPPFQLISYLIRAVPVGLAAGVAYVAAKGFGQSSLKAGGAALVGALAGVVLPYIGFADQVLGLAEESTAVFYTPFIAFAVWTALAYAQDDRD
ncbi:MAG: protein kinase [Nitrospinae bacterium]|nr:protein kinase [Nitrospinota bacterium]